MWNMWPDPPYIPAKFGEDSLKLKQVMTKNHRILNSKNNNKNKNNNKTDETLQEQKDIPITWGCPNKNIDETLQKLKENNTHFEASICPVLMNEASLERAYTHAHFAFCMVHICASK